jgi:hypothetical protein
MALAGRFRAPDLATRDFVRVIEVAAAWVAVLAHSYEFPFSAGWGSGGAAACGEIVHAAWTRHAGAPLARLDAAVTALVADYPCDRYQPDDDTDTGGGAATFVAVLDDGIALHARWLGDETALVVRDRAIAWRTTGHSVRELLIAQGHDLAGVTVPSLVTKMIARDAMHVADRPDAATFADVRAGDRLVLVGHEAIANATFDELAACVAPDASDAENAQAIVELVVARADPFGVAVVVRTLRPHSIGY